MINEEAIQQIDDVLSSDYHYDETLGYQLTSYDFEWLEKSKKALEKQIPKKVNISLKGTTDWNTKCHCPICHSMVSSGKYCANCGQALNFNSDGSDTE